MEAPLKFNRHFLLQQLQNGKTVVIKRFFKLMKGKAAGSRTKLCRRLTQRRALGNLRVRKSLEDYLREIFLQETCHFKLNLNQEDHNYSF